MGKKKMIYPVNQGKSSFKRSILEQVAELHKEVISIKKDIKGEAEKIIDKEMKSRLTLVEFALKEVRLFCELLVEKGVATQDEISQKRDKIRREHD